MDDAVPDDLDQVVEVPKDVKNRARRVQDRAARANAGGAPEAKSDRSPRCKLDRSLRAWRNRQTRRV